MAEQKIELRKIRDFSEIINDTFVFIRQNIKPLLISFLGIAGVFMLAAAIINGVFQSQMGNIFKDIFTRSTTSSTAIFSFFSGTYFLLMAIAWMNIVAMKVSITAYMKVYDAKGGETPTMPEVWNEFKKYYLKVLIYSIPIILLIAVGCLFCLVPGVYLWVVLMPFEMLLMVEDRSFGDAFNRCFIIIKQNFWTALGIYFVSYLIYYFCSAIIGGMMGLIGGAIGYFTTENLAGTIGIFTSILNIFSFVFFIIYFVAVVLNYFSLSEKYDGTGMMKRLNSLGDTTTTFNATEEQY